jgi:hypothetical protein
MFSIPKFLLLWRFIDPGKLYGTVSELTVQDIDKVPYQDRNAF